MTAVGGVLFPTEIGQCAVAWNASGICCVLLPESSDVQTRKRLAARLGQQVPLDTQAGAPPPLVFAAIAAIQRLLAGGAADLDFIALDMSGLPDFNARVYAITRGIAPGQTRTYGSIARELGDVRLARPRERSEERRVGKECA